MERKIRIFHPVFDIGFYLVVCTSLVFAVITSLVYPNVILEQGLSHRIFYLHVPVAWVALYGPILSFLFSLIFLLLEICFGTGLLSQQTNFLFCLR